MGVVLEFGSVPENLAINYGNGQGIVRSVEELSDLCERYGLTRLDHFIVDRNVLEEDAIEKAGWVNVPPKDEYVLYTDLGDLGYVAAEKERWRIMQEVQRRIPWFEPADGLRTVVGLIRAINRGIPHALREDLWRRRVRRLVESGMDPELVKKTEHRPDPRFPLLSCLFNLRTFEVEIAYAEREGVRFHFAVSY